MGIHNLGNAQNADDGNFVVVIIVVGGTILFVPPIFKWLEVIRLGGIRELDRMARPWLNLYGA